MCVFLILSLAACRLSEREVETGIEPEVLEAEEEEGPHEDTDRPPAIEISIWDCLDAKERMALMDSVEEFTEKNPGTNIGVRHIRSEEELLDQFEAASLAGSGPDIAIVDLASVQRMAESNVIKEITDVQYNRFWDGLTEISEHNGRKYMVPFRVTDFLVFYYNKDFVERAPRDFESLVEYCLEESSSDDPGYGFVLNHNEPDWIIPFIGGYSTWVIDYSNYSLSLDTRAMENTLEFLLMLYDSSEPIIEDMHYEEMDTLFKSGDIHMIINSFRVRDQYLEEGINLGTSIIPQVYGEGKNPTPLISGVGLILNSNSFGEEERVAKDFIEFILSTEQQVEWTKKTNTMPAVVAASEDNYFKNNDILSNVLRQAEISRGIPPENIMRVLRDSIRINVPRVISGELDVDEAAKKIQDDALRLRSGNVTIEALREELLQ